MEAVGFILAIEKWAALPGNTAPPYTVVRAASNVLHKPNAQVNPSSFQETLAGRFQDTVAVFRKP